MSCDSRRHVLEERDELRLIVASFVAEQEAEGPKDGRGPCLICAVVEHVGECPMAAAEGYQQRVTPGVKSTADSLPENRGG